MEAMSAPPPSRHSPFLQQSGLRVPSLPIPIPARRITTNPPPRSPEREYSSSDLVFDMSPVAQDDAPLKVMQTQPPNSGADAYQRKPYMPFSRLAACSGSPTESMRPYAQEPFLYSIPRLPSRMSFAHGRSQSEILSPKLPKADVTFTGVDSCSPSTASPVSPLPSKCGVQVCSPYVVAAPLTDAFQNSLSSGTTYTTSSSFSPSPDSDILSLQELPPITQQSSGYKTTRRSQLGSHAKGTHPTGILRTSAAAPVLSFAQVELDATGHYAKEARVNRGKPKSPTCSTIVSRARSPYPLVRGRRSSILRERSMRFSDDDITGTLKHDSSYEKFGLEKYLPTVTQKRNGKDENVIGDVLIEKERGRTRSRARGGLRH